jgi:hypothetical protein
MFTTHFQVGVTLYGVSSRYNSFSHALVWRPENRDSSVCIALGYGLDVRGPRVRFTADGNFLFTTASTTALGPTQPPIQWVPGALSVKVKRPGREADHSPPSSAEVTNAWSYTSTPEYVFIAWCLIKRRDNFTFLPM